MLIKSINTLKYHVEVLKSTLAVLLMYRELNLSVCLSDKAYKIEEVLGKSLYREGLFILAFLAIVEF